MGDWVNELLQPWEKGSAQRAQESADKAISQQQAASDRAMTLSENQFDYQRQLNEPFYNLGLPAFGTLAATVTGQPSTYADPRYQKLADDDINRLTDEWIQSKGLPSQYTFDYRSRPELLADMPYKHGGTYYRGPSGEIVDKVPTVTAQAFQPQDSPAFQWQKERTLADLGRTLRMQGRSNSTAGLNATGRVLGDLNASEYDKQLGRLADLTNIARGGASTLAGASAGFTNAAGSNLLNMGANQANATLAGSALRQNNLYNNQQSAMSLANLGLKLYDQYKNNNSGGGGYMGGGGGGGYGGEGSYGVLQSDAGYNWDAGSYGG